MNLKGYQGKWAWRNSKYYRKICLEETRQTTKNLNEQGRYPSRDFNLRRPEYEAGMVTTRPGCSIFLTDWLHYTSSALWTAGLIRVSNDEQTKVCCRDTKVKSRNTDCIFTLRHYLQNRCSCFLSNKQSCVQQEQVLRHMDDLTQK